MRHWDLGGPIRALRRRERLTQAQLAARIGCSHDLISRIELDRCDSVPAGRLRDCVEALGGRLRVDVEWFGEALPRLLDARHAALQNRVAAHLGTWGWVVRAEVSFNHYGDRGRVDLVAFHPPTRAAAVVEIKPRLNDVQDTLGRLDVKARLARHIAARCGWASSGSVPLLVLGEGTTQRRMVTMHAALFRPFTIGRAAATWLRSPALPAPDGLLLFVAPDQTPPADWIGVSR